MYIRWTLNKVTHHWLLETDDYRILESIQRRNVPIGGKIGLQGCNLECDPPSRGVVSCAARSFIFVLLGVISSFSVILLVSPPLWPTKSRSALRYDTVTLSRTRRAKKRGGSRKRRRNGACGRRVSLFFPLEVIEAVLPASPRASRSRWSFETSSQVHYRQETLPAARTWPLCHGQVRQVR